MRLCRREVSDQKCTRQLGKKTNKSGVKDDTNVATKAIMDATKSCTRRET